MDKKIIIFGLLTLLPIIVSAQINFSPPGTLPENPATALTRIANFVWTIAAGVSVIMLIWAGVMFLTAAGNPQKIKQAQDAFFWGVVGVAVTVIAFSVPALVKYTLGVQGAPPQQPQP